MARPYSAPMPEQMDLGGGYQLRLSAVDPTTGNGISAITITNLTMLVDTGEGTSGGDLAVGPYLLVPGSGA